MRVMIESIVKWLSVLTMAWMLEACSMVLPKTVGRQIGPSALVEDWLATLVITEEPRIPSLVHQPEKDRFRLELLLNGRGGEGKLMELARNQPYNAISNSARILGADGERLWFFTNEIGAYEVRSGRRAYIHDFKRANPELASVWDNARWQFDGGRMYVTTHDYQRSWVIDTGGLAARPSKGPDRRAGLIRHDANPYDHLIGGSIVKEGEWLGVLSAKDAEVSFQSGARVLNETAAKKGWDARRIYRGRVEGNRLISIAPVRPGEYVGAAMVRDLPLVVYWSKAYLNGRLLVTHVEAEGGWPVDTGLGDLDQILPTAQEVVFIGREPKVEGKVQHPLAVWMNVKTGKLQTVSLRP